MQAISTRTYMTSTIVLIALSLLVRFLYIGANDLLVEEAYYWNYAQHLDFSYLDHPPMVAWLIKTSTAMFGNNEFGVRIPSLFCWLLTAFFSFKLTQLVSRGAGLYAVMLLSILPFFFLQSLVITPDQPLIVCWSAALYFLYRALVLKENNAWYTSGVWLGLGLLSKYTIVLLGPTTLLYICITPSARFWLLRKEPYLAALIALLFFTPVLYWNAQHEWVSFLFQTTRRLEANTIFSLHHLLALLFFFLMPSGILSLSLLFKKSAVKSLSNSSEALLFFQIFILLPLMFFGLFSLTHAVKFNWIGPGLLATLPWLAILMKESIDCKNSLLYQSWLLTAVILLISYNGALFSINFGLPDLMYRTFFTKFIAWHDLTQQIHALAEKTGTTPVILPLDRYEINSEFNFYETKDAEQGLIKNHYAIQGQHLFGGESLMYQYWLENTNLTGKAVLLISNKQRDFENPSLIKKITDASPISKFWAHNQGRGANIIPYYYQLAKIK